MPNNELKILVVMASYGHTNDRYLSQVLAEYRSMPYAVDIIVISNIPKELGSDVQVIVGLPSKNPYSLPFAHKRLFAERADQYDLFIYAEDDILITQGNIEAFVAATEILNSDEIAGFVHAEVGQDNELYYDPPHFHFHWDPDSVVNRGNRTFAFYTNVHSACFVLTRDHLRRAIDSGGFVVGPHEGRYELRETAATDPYTQCGFKKLICVSHLDEFTVRHLPANKYAIRPYRARAVFEQQIAALLNPKQNRQPHTMLFEPETKVLHGKWSKDYYEMAKSEVLGAIPVSGQSILSIGCGWGATEEVLVNRGQRVVAIPLDAVIASCAESKGIKIVYGDWFRAGKELQNQTFDCILLSNVLHLMEDPVTVLLWCFPLLSSHGVIVVCSPNFSQLTTRWRRFLRRKMYRDLGDFEKTGIQVTTPSLLRKWFRSCGFNINQFRYVIPQRGQLAYKLSLKLSGRLIGEEFVCVGRKRSAMATGVANIGAPKSTAGDLPEHQCVK